MSILNHYNRHAKLLACTLLLCASLVAHADDVKDANMLFKQGQNNQALDKLNGYLANKPKDAQARFLKGLILAEQGKTADAIKIFSALTDDYPERSESYNNLAVLYAGQGQYDKTKVFLEKAIRSYPSYATAHENLGDINAKIHDRTLKHDHSNTPTKLAMIQNLFADDNHNKESAGRNNSVPINPAEASQVNPAEASQASAAGDHDKPVSDVDVTTIKDNTPAPTSEGASKKDNNQEALETVKAWAAAWSAKNTDKYLSFYAKDFKTPSGEDREAWEATRRERISKPKNIKIGIGNMTILFIDSDHATVNFRQSYRSSHMKDSTNKTLLMVKSSDKWLIQEERSK